MKRTLGLDVGDKTVGLALSDALGITAQGLDTLARRNIEADLAAITSLCAEHEVELLVVGLPLNMDGSEGPRAELTRRFGDKLAARTGLPAQYWDERLTTAEAERVLISADVSRQKRKKVIDKLAAQVILQSWLDAHATPPSEPEDDP
jgi:putative holliday junction resolvase